MCAYRDGKLKRYSFKGGTQGNFWISPLLPRWLVAPVATRYSSGRASCCSSFSDNVRVAGTDPLRGVMYTRQMRHECVYVCVNDENMAYIDADAYQHQLADFLWELILLVIVLSYLCWRVSVDELTVNLEGTQCQIRIGILAVALLEFSGCLHTKRNSDARFLSFARLKKVWYCTGNIILFKALRVQTGYKSQTFTGAACDCQYDR